MVPQDLPVGGLAAPWAGGHGPNGLAAGRLRRQCLRSPKAYESTATLLPQLDSKEGGSLAALLATTFGAAGMAQNLVGGMPSMPTTPTDVFVAILKSR